MSALAAVAVAVSPAANAAAQRTFVASYGAPANTAFNCSIAKPCRAFSEAIGVTNPGGEVIVLDSAGYGSVTVTKAVLIVAPAGIYAGISVLSGNDGVTVNAPGAIVVLRRLSINGQGGNRGIFVQAAARVRIESCVVSGMGTAGIAHLAAGAEMIVLDTIVRDNSGSGIVVNGDGLSFAPPPGSLGALAMVVNSVFAHNEGKGIGVSAPAGATTTTLVERSVMAYNGQDGVAAAAGAGSFAVATLTRNAINDNGGHGIWMQGRSTGTASENAVHRNSGNGIFLDGDQILWISANAASRNMGFDLICNNGFGGLYSLRNNATDSLSSTGCYVAKTGS